MFKIQGNWFFLIWTFELKKKNAKKMKFLILFLCKKIRWYVICNKKLKKLKVSVLFIFFFKIYFGMSNKKNDSIWNKKLLWKIYRVENDRKKREVFYKKMFVWRYDGSSSRPITLAKSTGLSTIRPNDEPSDTGNSSP